MMNSKNKRGFASMVKEKIQAIGRKGGETRKKELGSEGYSAMGHKGGEARKRVLGRKGYSAMGRKSKSTRNK